MNCQAMKAVDMAVSTVLSTDAALIVLEINNGFDRFHDEFPSLTDEQHDMLHGPVFLSFDTDSQARSAFEQFTLDATLAEQASESDTGSTGTITLIMRPYGKDDEGEIFTWTVGDKARPVFRDGNWDYVETTHS